jgi:integrase
MNAPAPKFRIIQEEDGRWLVDVRGTLPDGDPFRSRTRPKNIRTRRDAETFAQNTWNAAWRGDIKQREAATPTVREYAEKWLEAREKRGLSSAKANRHQMAHLLPTLGDTRLSQLTRKEIAAAVVAIQQSGKRSKRGGTIAPRTVLHSYSLLRTMLDDAVADGLIEANPATLRARRQELPRKQDKDPTWRRTAVYSADELKTMISDQRLAWPVRVAYALEGLAGLRFGEASAIRWKSYTADRPLNRLDIFEAYDSNNDRLKATKTDTHRAVPVHPALAAILDEWHATGWRATYGRKPGPDDLIVPAAEGKKLRHRKGADGRKVHAKSLAVLGLRHRREHDLRRTFVTLCRTGGASKELLVWVSHGVQSSSISDLYTTPPWSVLCDLVLCLRLPD